MDRSLDAVTFAQDSLGQSPVERPEEDKLLGYHLRPQTFFAMPASAWFVFASIQRKGFTIVTNNKTMHCGPLRTAPREMK